MDADKVDMWVLYISRGIKMKFQSEYESLKELGLASTLNENQMNNLIRLAKPGKNDVFYDLGSGYGNIVRYFAANSRVSKSIGIESDHKRFLISIEKTRDELGTKLDKIEFWCAPFHDYNFSDATIIYCGLKEIDSNPGNDNFLKDIFEAFFDSVKIKIILRDLPLVGFRATEIQRERNGLSFFLMNTPLSEHIITSKSEWIKHVLQKNGTTQDLVDYVVRQYRNRGFTLSQKEITKFYRGFERISKKRFIT